MKSDHGSGSVFSQIFTPHPGPKKTQNPVGTAPVTPDPWTSLHQGWATTSVNIADGTPFLRCIALLFQVKCGEWR